MDGRLVVPVVFVRQGGEEALGGGWILLAPSVVERGLANLATRRAISMSTSLSNEYENLPTRLLYTLGASAQESNGGTSGYGRFDGRGKELRLAVRSDGPGKDPV